MKVLNREEAREPQQELVEDLVAMVTGFAGGIYGAGSRKRQEVVEAVEQAVRDC